MVCLDAQVLSYWPFGGEWCSVWLAVDVWLCTASILNLCAISLDRYLAISRPFEYPRLVSPLHAKMLIVGVWILSFIICFPPLIGWKEGTATQTNPRHCSATVGYWPEEDEEEEQDEDEGQNESRLLPGCHLTSEPGYIVYSACGSFWIPMIVMVGFYWRIYKTASAATEALRRGFIEQKAAALVTGGGGAGGSANLSASSSENSITLRVHRGGSPKASTQFLSPPLKRRSFDDRLLAVGPASDVNPSPSLDEVDTPKTQWFTRSSATLPQIVVTASSLQQLAPSPDSLPGWDVDHRTSSIDSGCPIDGRRRKSSRFTRLMHIVPQLRSLNKEKKAAKTVGVIVGLFIVCWAPFFSVYLSEAFCRSCTPDLLFKVFFWLGYCNSAANPVIYGLCSRDFRYAFKKLLRCRCERKMAVRRTGSRFMRILPRVRLEIITGAADSNS